ncbi:MULTISPECIES: transcriptional regulator [unclassified Brevundimonas]|uniref:transcriptional regulator n=1 Tax=unclassified Brevundimonas TaxID=2622653 RepID=UPI003F901963
MAYLSADGDGDFTELAQALDIPNNALSSQLYRLEAADYVRLEKGFLGRRPRTRVRLTATGRAAWASHLEQLEAGFPR